MLICQQILAIVITKYHSVHISTQCNQDNTSTFGFRLTNLLFLFTPGSDKSHWIVAVQIFTGGQISFLSESSHWKQYVQSDSRWHVSAHVDTRSEKAPLVTILVLI